ncbi:hypothetical protein L2719_10385 [Shewanella schlegeliana]|uniref:Uncharacterized protein n=1 Tax=Shewanella schlegeliana TaxID=190308 RepID=A0ABS1T1P0_9GAMM|nr:hypothetical protein [Shewanella schlegeliana]MBL4914713.1 hypothetical protein [Shewanella schlegeliana]MCL1109955.1 hypothetical protein [Shewanella schlegeliana]GIU25489.1 hypothetical protein TUM4433_10310 [Shewanella schlegeliana]
MYIRMLPSILVSSLLLLSSIALPVFAANDLSGIWQGTLGKSKIRVCFNEYGTGSYYYQRYLTPIRLEQVDSHWQEENSTGYWQFDNVNEQQLIGLWFNKEGFNKEPSASDKSLAIMLERQISSDGINDCSSNAYNQPLETAPKLSRGKWQHFEDTDSHQANSHQISYRQLSYGTEIGLEFKGDHAGITVINQWLKQKLTSDTLLAETFETRRRMLAQVGLPITDETGAEPSFINQHWLSVKFYRWAAGYGAGGINRTFTSFNLSDGKPFNPWQWFIEGADIDEMRHQLPPALREKLFADMEVFEDCDNSDGSGYFYLTLSSKGIELWETPNGSGCENEFTLSPQEAMLFASEYGKSQLKLME